MKIKEIAKQNLLKKEAQMIEELVPHILARADNWGLSRNKLERIVWTTALLEMNRNIVIKVDKDIEDIVNKLVYTNKRSIPYHCVYLIECKDPYITLILEEKLKWKSRKEW